MKTSPVQLDLTMDFDSRCENLKCLKKAHADIHMESSVCDNMNIVTSLNHLRYFILGECDWIETKCTDEFPY